MGCECSGLVLFSLGERTVNRILSCIAFGGMLLVWFISRNCWSTYLLVLFADFPSGCPIHGNNTKVHRFLTCNTTVQRALTIVLTLE